MSFFHNLNKTLDSIAARPEAAQLNERDMGKHNNATTGFKALAKKAGGGEKGERIAGAQFQKMKKAGQLEEESVDEGLVDVVKKVGGMAKKAGGAVLNKVGHGDDVDMIRDLQRKMGVAQTGKKPKQVDELSPATIQSAAAKRDAQQPDQMSKATQRKDIMTHLNNRNKMTARPDQADEGAIGGAIGATLGGVGGALTGVPGAALAGTALGGGIGGAMEEDGVGEGLAGAALGAGLAGSMDGLGMAPMGALVGNAIGDIVGSPTSNKGSPAQPTQVKEKMNPAKQKSFAKLAPPRDKITFADKIAGAKKEVDEMLGDVAAEAMRNALGGRQQVADEGNEFINSRLDAIKAGKPSFKVGNKSYRVTGDTSDEKSMVEDDKEDLNPFTNYKKPRADTPRVGDVTHGAKHDIKHTATGRVVTRRVDPQGMSVGSETDAEGNTIDKRGRGRPKGPAKGPERTTAKAYKHKGERKVKENEHDSDEVKQAMAVLKKAGYKVSKAVEEESTHTRDDHAEKAGKRVAKDIEYDEKKKDGIHGKKRGAEDSKAERAGKKVAKDIEYDDKKDEVKEDEPKKSKSKFKFGGSVYETLDAQLETLITEGMSVTVNMSQNSEDGQEHKNITVNADGEDADRLAELLKMAGMSQQSSGCGCGQSPCGCDVIDENDPNWPSNTETSDNALQYSGGLNGPKSTGQTTIPVIAGQEERMGQDDLSRLREMAGMRQDSRLDEGMMDKIKGMMVPKLMKLLGPDAEKIASAVKQATGGDFTPSKENAMKVVQALGIDKAAEQGQSPQMAEGIAGNWQGKLIQALYTLGLLGSAAVTMWASGPGRGTGLGVASGLITVIGVVLLMFANTFFSSDSGMVGAMGRKGRQGFDTNESLNKTEQNLLNLYQTFRK